MTKTGMESENEFDVDEPEEVKPDDWKPESNTRRQSARLRVSRLPVILDSGSTDDDLSDVDSDFERIIPKKRRIKETRKPGGRGGRRGRPPSKLARVSSTTSNGLAEVETAGSEDNSNAAHVSGSDTEPTSTTTTNSSSATNQSAVTFQSGAFVVLKKDFKNSSEPPIWKIDGKALLQKYIPFQLDGKVFYKNTSVYSGWTINNKHQYYSCSVLFRQQNKKEHVIEFLRDNIIPDEDDENSKSGGEEEEQEDGDDEEEEEGDELDKDADFESDEKKNVAKLDEEGCKDLVESSEDGKGIKLDEVGEEKHAETVSSKEDSEIPKEIATSSVGPNEK